MKKLVLGAVVAASALVGAGTAVAATSQTTTVTYHYPATQAPDGKWTCAEINTTQTVPTSSIPTTQNLRTLIYGSLKIVITYPDGSTRTYVNNAAVPENSCSDPFAPQP